MAYEPDLFPISVEGRWGYIDRAGKVVIKPQFTKAEKFSEGLALVGVTGTSEEDKVFKRTNEGFIGPDGKFVIAPKPPPEAHEVDGFWTYSYSDFHEGLAKIHLNDSSGIEGYVDRTGKLVIPFQFDYAGDFSQGLAFAKTWRHWQDDQTPVQAGFIDKQGKFTLRNDDIRFGYDIVESRGVVSVPQKGDAYAQGLVDRDGKFVIQPGIYRLSSPVNGTIVARKDRQDGMLDLDGKVIVPFGEYDDLLAPWHGAYFTAKKGNKTFVLDEKGNQLAEVQARGSVSRFADDMATIERDGKVGFIDAQGKLRIDIQFDRARPFEHR